jgi:hypothetical protein
MKLGKCETIFSNIQVKKYTSIIALGSRPRKVKKRSLGSDSFVFLYIRNELAGSHLRSSLPGRLPAAASSVDGRFLPPQPCHPPE